MYKDSKWAKEIIFLQSQDGQWGYFHTLSEPKKYPITTEQALRRLQILGYTIDDLFANKVANKWANIISFAFRNGEYSHEDYLSAYKQTFSKNAKGGRLIDFVSFYQVSIISDCLDPKTEVAVFDYITKHETGIYYIYNEPINNLPEKFESKNSSRYIRAIELLSDYNNNLDRLTFVIDWLNNHKNSFNKWDMGSSVKDFISYPLSDSWNKENRINDCTFRIEQLISKIYSSK